MYKKESLFGKVDAVPVEFQFCVSLAIESTLIFLERWHLDCGTVEYYNE